jgi:hypothetical protein
MVKRLGVLAIVLVMGLGAVIQVSASGSTHQAAATPDSNGADDFNITFTLTGQIASVGPGLIVLTDGTRIVIPPGFILPPEAVPGATVTVVIEIEGDDVRLISISILPPNLTATPTLFIIPTLTPTVTATAVGTLTVTPTATITAIACGSGNTQPVAARLAAAFKVSYTEIMNWHCRGFGFGEIARAYALALATRGTAQPLTVEQIFARRQDGEGWGNIVKSTGIKPGQLAPGLFINRGKGDDKQGENEDGDDKGNGKDKEKDKGKGNGKKGN